MATTLLAPSIVFVPMVSLLIKLMLVTLQSCGKSYVSTGCSELDFSFGLMNTELVIFIVGVLCHGLIFIPFGSV